MMKPIDAWLYDEFRHVGRDYGAEDEVRKYDESHSGFRDPVAEAEATLDGLEMEAGQTLVDFGCGTGTLAIQAARRGVNVRAVDVSPAMLAYARQKAQTSGVDGIAFCHAGFLTYEHDGAAADAITTAFALHHLPDFWKGVALERIHGMLRPGGQLFLRDVVVEPREAMQNVAAFIETLDEVHGESLREDTEMHFREEFSTYDWIMDGLLEHAGFRIRSKTIEHGVLATYHCVK